MSKTAFLEDFSMVGADLSKGLVGSGVDASAIRAAFDDGYKCGWQDGVDSINDRDKELREDLSSALQEVNFTYFEARQHVMKSVQPVLQAMVELVLPSLLAQSLGAQVVELLGAMANKSEPAITIACAADTEEMLKELIEASITFPVSLEVEPTLTTSQVVLHLNDGQTRIDFDATLEALRECVASFFDTSEIEEENHA